MIAALQMYDWPEVRPVTDGFWSEVARALGAAGVAAPEALSRPADISAPWRDPDLLLGQTCGLPFVSGRCGSAVLLARPVYGRVEGCGTDDAGRGTYRSALVARRGAGETLADFRGAVAAINELGSQSGCNALADAVADLGAPFFGAVTLTGAHRASAQAVARGEADLAAIDAVSWMLFARAEPEAHAALKVVAWSRPTPTLPYIMAPAHSGAIPAVQQALAKAAAASTDPVLPTAIGPAAPEDYRPISEMAARVRDRFGPDLARLAA